ncbi:hypothetical protein F4781DRAFT_146253 [Annulohypoxylon bovei var. microspora]|nr:hypothetical protein F4781DRAFT_146253 [Annulohypoxylon bovei var. microspora]
MKTFVTLLACPLIVAGIPMIPRSGPAPPGPWTAGVWKIAQGTDVFFWGDAINANNGKFRVNKNTTADFPDGIEGLDCSAYPGTNTVFVEGNGTISMNVGVPGGQQIYIAKDGSLSYTIPHSRELPDGSTTTGFYRSRSESFGAPINLFNSGRFWLICPVGEGEPREKTYQLFVETKDREECYGTLIRTYQADGINAWEYS